MGRFLGGAWGNLLAISLGVAVALFELFAGGGPSDILWPLSASAWATLYLIK
ncbi:hypothetical protein VPHK122_0002 [Vibrio phage K122]